MQKLLVGSRSYAGRKTLFAIRIMKIGLFLLLVSLNVSARTYSQKVSLTINNERLGNALKMLEKQTGYRFTYSNQVVPTFKQVSLTVKDRELKEVLGILLNNLSLGYHEEGGKIIIIFQQDKKTKPGAGLDEESKAFAEETHSLSGAVKSEKGEPLSGSTVAINYKNKMAIAAPDGKFVVDGIPAGKYILTVTSVGYVSQKFPVTIGSENVSETYTLREDNLQLDQVIVTSSGSQKRKIESSVAVSTVSAKQLGQRPPMNSTDMLKAIPGLSPESSGGDGPGSVRVRGLPGGGYVFMGVMEDGLPVLPTGFSTIPSADQYYKIDLTIKNVEAIRGGHAAMVLANTPGALINVLSNTGGEKFSGKARITRGLSQNASRVDLNLGGRLADKVKFNIGGFYRGDDGIRPPVFRANDGGQIKGNITFDIAPKSFVRLYGKYLNDKTTWLIPSYYAYDGSGLAKPFGSFDLLTQILMPRDYKTVLTAPDSKNYTVDYSDGVHQKTSSVGMEIKHETGNGWIIRNNFRFQSSSSSFNGAIVTAPVAYDPAKQYYYLNGQQLNNPSGYYTGQALTWSSGNDDQLSEKLDINKQLGKHALTFGAGLHTWKLRSTSLGASFNTEIANNPGILLVNTITGNGYSGVNISGYNDGKTTISSAWASDEVRLNKWTVDFGVRVDGYHVKGNRLIAAAPFTNTTPFDEKQTYNTLSLGLNYKINETQAIFSRTTKTYSALTIGNYAAFTFTPSSVRDRSVFMTEFGYKINTPKLSMFTSLVYASLSNISSSMLIPNTSGNFLSVPTFASSSNVSAEIEAVFTFNKHFNMRFTATFQNSKYTEYSVTAPANARADLAGKPFVWDGNKAERIPSSLYELSASYSVSKLDFFASFRQIGKRWSSPSNIYQLGAYNELSMGIEYKVAKFLGLRIWGDNILNSRGMTEGNVRGDQFLANGNFAKGSPQIGRVILPRSFWTSMTFTL